MMSVGVEMTSYLEDADQYRKTTNHQRNPQFDDMVVTEGPHIFKLASHTSLGLFPVYHSLRYVFHGNLVPSDGMHCH